MRELENILERALTLCTGGVDHRRAHPAAASAQRRGGPPSAARSLAPPVAEGSAALGDQLEDIERDAIVKALEKTRYNKTAAAKLLGHELPGAALPDQEARHRIAPRVAALRTQLTVCVTF